MLAQVRGPLPLAWETWMEFLALGFNLAQTWLLGCLGSQSVDQTSLCLSPSLSLLVTLPFKKKNLKNKN